MSPSVTAQGHQRHSPQPMTIHFQPVQTADSAPDREVSANKRRRVPVACRECRGRKSRCNGAHPTCSTCQSIGATCVYEQPAIKTFSHPNSRVEAPMENRLRALEEKMDSLSDVRRYRRSSSGMDSPRDEDAQRFERDDNSMRSSNSGSQTNQSQRNPMALEDDVDGMGIVNWTEDRDISGIFGLSSNVSLFRKVSRAAVQMTNARHTLTETTPNTGTHLGQSNAQRSSASSLGISQNISSRRMMENPSVVELPSEPETTALIRHYFSNIGLLIPCVHEHTFLTEFEQAQREGFHTCRPSWLALMNMIFASSSLNTNSSFGKGNEAETYFQRALAFIGWDMLFITSVEIVQVLLHIEVFLMASQRSMQTWTFHALAIKSALQFGLHSAESYKRLGPLDREVRKRTWYWCVLNDRLFSCMFGRPAMIVETDILLERPIDINKDFPAVNFSGSTMSTSVSFYNALITLSRLMEEAVEQLYNRNIDPDVPLCTSEVLIRKCRLSSKLFEWKQTLPPNLQFITAAEILGWSFANVETSRFRVLLTMLYLGVRILVIRPVAVEFLDFQMDSKDSEYNLTLLRGAGLLDLKEGVQVCVDIISLVGSIVTACENGADLVGSLWYAAYYTFNASLVLFAVILASNRPQVSSLITADFAMNMRNSLNQAVEVLQSLEKRNSSVGRCRSSLGKLLDIHDSIYNLGTFPLSSRPLLNSEPAIDGMLQEDGHPDNWPCFEAMGSNITPYYLMG